MGHYDEGWRPEPSTNPEKLVERVAKAICIALGDDPNREGERLTAYDTAAEAAIYTIVKEALKGQP